MASAELKQYVAEVAQAVNACKKNTKSVDLDTIEAVFKASQVALFTEQDTSYSLALTKKAKELLAERIYLETQGEYTLWQLENYAIAHDSPYEEINFFYEVLKQESYFDFQSFIYFMERNRKADKRFYYPRRNTLHTVLSDLTKFERGDFKFYGLSMPPRTGKSTLCIFFINWIMMKRPNSHNAMIGYSGQLAKGFFNEIMTFVTSADYCFKELYEFWHPSSVLVQNKSAEAYTVNLDKPDRFSTLTCRGIDGSLTGAVDISSDGFLYVDDIVRDREESMSVSRMENLYQKYQNEVLDRKQDNARELMVGTLWSVNDPLERTRILFQDDPAYVFRRIPALDEKDHSNFNYEINGFSDKYYLDLRKRLDSAEWQAKYMQQPFVREGLLFPVEELRMFEGIIPDDGRESETVAVIDPAFGGGDSLSMPICRDYGHKERYIIDWVFNRGTQSKTVPLIVNKIIQHYITRVQIEKNSGGQLLADSIKQEMERRGVIHCKITLVSAPVKMSKEDKISAYSDFVKEHFIFLIPNQKRSVKDLKEILYKRTSEYQKAIEEMCMYSAQGKQPHDDAPDSIVQLAMFFDRRKNGTIEIPHNPFKAY